MPEVAPVFDPACLDISRSSLTPRRAAVVLVEVAAVRYPATRAAWTGGRLDGPQGLGGREVGGA